MTEETNMLLVERPEEGVLLLRLNRPEKRNALATPLLRLVAETLTAEAASGAVRVAIITGSGKVFAAGADINELAQKDVAGALSDPRPPIWAAIRAFPLPLIAAVEGWSLGAGNELLMCCDLAIAGVGAKFGQPETNLGIIPGAGGTATLPRLVGRSAAMKMVLLGEPISAQEAQALGLVADVVEDGSALTTALAMASKISRRAPLAMRQAKALINAAFEAPHSVHLSLERQAFSAMFGSADRAEGIAAFLERRDPNWNGR